MKTNKKYLATVAKRWGGSASYHAKRLREEQARETPISEEVWERIRNAHLYRDPNGRRTDRFHVGPHNLSEAYSHHTTQVEAERLAYSAFIDTAFDAKWGFVWAFAQEEI